VPVWAVQPDVLVSAYNIKSGNLAVGKDFVLSLTLTNIQPAACAQDITTNVQASFPFILDGVSTLPAANLCSGNSGASTTVNFPMKIDPTAKGGSYQLTITNNYETPTLVQFSTTNVLNLFVQGTPELNAYITNYNPIDVYPGDTATLTISLENDGSFQAQSVTATLSANSSVEVSPANSFSSFGLIDAKQSKTATFTIEIPKNAEAKNYPLNLEVQYQDQNLAMQTKSYTLIFHVKPKASFETSDAGSDILYPNQNSRTVKLLLKNTGTNTAYNIKAKIMPQYPFSTDGSIRYVNIIEPGKSVPVEFKVDVDKDATIGSYGLDLLMNFEDAQGKSLQDTAKMSLTVASEGLFRAIFVDYWFLWVIVIAVIVLVIRKRKKSAQKKKTQ
jgi:hypothetical protein